MNASTSAIACASSFSRSRTLSTCAHVFPKSELSAKLSVIRKLRPGACSREVPMPSAKSTSSACVVLVRDREDVVEDGDAIRQLLRRNRERRADHEDVPGRHQEEAAA